MIENEVIQSLHSADPSQRIQAIIAIKALGIEKSTEILLSALDTDNVEIQRIITATLLEFGKPITPILIKNIKPANQLIRDSIVNILSEVFDISYNVHLLNLLSDHDCSVRAAAIEILGQVKDIWSIPHIREFIKDPEPIVRTKSAAALGNMNDILSVDLILQLLSDESSLVRITALEALAKLNEPRSCDSIWQVSTRDKDPQVRKTAVQTLKIIGNNLIAPYQETFTSTDIETRTHTIQKLSELGRCVILPLIELTKHYSASVREIVAIILGNIADPVVARRLIELTNDMEPKVRIAAIKGLGNIRDETTLRFLISCLKDLDPIIISTATTVLAERGEEVVKYLPSILSEQDMNSQITVTRLIGKIQNPNLVNMLAEHLSDPRLWIRRTVCFALGETKNPLAADLLIEKCLFDQDTLVRAAAAQALGKLRMSFVLDSLISALDDDEESVKISVIKAIGELQITDSGSHLLKYLSSESVILKITAIQTLVKLHYIGAIPLLKPMARSWPFGKETEEIRAEAKLALKILEQEKRHDRP
ncbi:MAG: HEAT repeat domain-containing protein [Candidatus Latescibacteria bacterium]|nr:HEAT repeat domain-containing protein [Candidatus Latescibacterota bacterium]